MILDTNALSAVADADPAIAAAFASLAPPSIPVVVLGEYRFGIAQSSRKRGYEQWLHLALQSCRILDIGEETTRHYADIRLQLRAAGTPIPSNDAWIAALARQHSLSVLSRDRHFDIVPGIRRMGW